MNGQKNYSKILLEFIEPICNEHDDEKTLFAKLQLGRVAWNYCLAQEYGLPPTFSEDAERACLGGPNLKAGFDQLVARKINAFARYTDIIISVDIKYGPNDTFVDVDTVKLEEVGRRRFEA
jgi:hypothetical protein